MNNALKASIVALIIAVCLIVFLFKSRTGKLVGISNLIILILKITWQYTTITLYGEG